MPIGNNLDPQVYVEWGRRIAAGDWIGKDVFTGMPLYAYFLGLIFLIFKNSISAAVAVQLFMSSLNCLLIFIIGKRLFNLRIGFIAGLISCLYLPFLFNDAMLTSSILITTLNLLALYLLLCFEKKISWGYICTAGIVLGLAALSRASALLFLPCIMLWIIFAFRNLNLRKRLAFSLVLFLYAFAAILPVSMRNYLLTGEKILITPYGGINFYIGNNPAADGMFSPPRGMRRDSPGLIEDAQKIAEKISGKKLTLAETSDFWVKNTLGLIAQNPGTFSKLIARKFLYFWNGYEIPDVSNYYFIKRFVPLLRWPFFSFVVIGPLGLLGLALSFNKRRDIFIIYVFLLSYIVSIILFFINARYRLTIVPLVIIFSAFALDKLFEILHKHKYKPLMKYLLLLAAFALFVNIGAGIKRADYSVSYDNLGIALYGQGKIEEAREAFLKSIEIAPDYAEAYNNLGTIYFEQDDKEKAKEYFQRALDLQPGHPVFRQNMALVDGWIPPVEEAPSSAAAFIEQIKGMDKTAEEYKAVLERDPHDTTARVNLANIYLRLNKLDEALEEYKRALEEDPDLLLAHYNLGILYFKRKEFNAARKEWKAVLGLDPDFAPAKEALEKLP